MRKRNHATPGFTLIELLIVVGIIAILALIAVPNFLSAQVRAKVSRAQSDMRAIATALEAYRVDENAYPVDWDSEQYGELEAPGEWKTYRSLTTPIAYMTSAPLDPFNQNGVVKPGGYYDYWGRDGVRRRYEGRIYWESWVEREARWVLYSYGPDLEDQCMPCNFYIINYLLYDPTNGTNSAGDFGRSNHGVHPAG